MSSKFYFGASNSSASSLDNPNTRNSDPDSDNDDSTLPYPTPLPRASFLTPQFNAQEYLSSLGTRHQTLEDLRSELRARSQLLNTELLDLVNTHYADFLGLGVSLKGGEEKVEALRVGLLGFRREVESLRKAVIARETEVDSLLEQRKAVRKEIQEAMRCIEFDERLGKLEAKLMLGDNPSEVGRSTVDFDVALSDSEADESEDDEEGLEGESDTVISLKKIGFRVDDFRYLKQLTKQIRMRHPFILAQQERMMRARNTLLLDLSTALKQAKTAGNIGTGRIMKILTFYRDMDEAKEATIALKSM